MSTISIALCTYNGERWLKEQLDSYITQHRQPDELIVCDDRSTDGTVWLVERFAASAPFVVEMIVNDANLGSTRNFEKAVSLCKGDLIFLSDQDDVWLPAKLDRIEREFAANENAGLVFSDAELVDEELTPLGATLTSLTFRSSTRRDLKNGKAFVSLLDQNFVTGGTMAFRSKFRDILSPAPERVPNLIHDAWIALSIANEAPIIFVDEPLIKYRQHGQQQVGLRIGLEEDRKRFFAKTIEMLEGEIERLRAMQTMLEDLPRFQKPSVDGLIREKHEYLEHCVARRDFPRSRSRRIAPIFREFATGRYGRFSRGALSAAKDLFED